MRYKLFLATCVLILMCAPSAAQESAVSLSSTVPASARFEIVQSPLLAKLTFRLDRVTGDTWQFVSKKKGDFTWQPIERIGLPNDSRVQGKVNYQIFLSGVRAQVTILMNTNTGVSWYISEDSKEGVFWAPIK